MKLYCAFVLLCCIKCLNSRHARKITNKDNGRFELKKPFLARKPPFKHKQQTLYQSREIHDGLRPLAYGVPPAKVQFQDNRWDPVGPVGQPLANKKPVQFLKKTVFPKKQLYLKKRQDTFGRPPYLIQDISRIDTLEPARRIQSLQRGSPILSYPNQPLKVVPAPNQQVKLHPHQLQQQQLPQQLTQLQALKAQQNQQYHQYQQQQQQLQDQQQLFQQQTQYQQQPPQGDQQQQQQDKQTLQFPDSSYSQSGGYEEIGGVKVYKFRGTEGRGTYDRQELNRLNTGGETHEPPAIAVKWSQAQVFGPPPSTEVNTTVKIQSGGGPTTPAPPFPTIHTTTQPNQKAAPVVIIAQSNVSQN